MGLIEILGPATYQIMIRVGWALMIIVILAGLFFGTRYAAKAYKKRKNYKINAAIFNPDGSWHNRKIGKFRDKDKVDKMLFLGSKETMPVINPKYIRNNSIALWRYGVGQYAVIPPNVWVGMDPKHFKIDPINMQMKNFAYLEQRAAVSRWSYIKDALQRWAPYITVLLILILAGVAVWFMMKTGLEMYNSVISARVAECKDVIGGSIAPLS